MKWKNIDVRAKVKQARELLEKEKNISRELASTVKDILSIMILLCNRLNLNSSNSSKPPSQDPNRKKKNFKQGQRRPGGQQGHEGVTLQKVENPEKIEELYINRKTLPPGKYKNNGFECRQVIDIRISRFVTEYRAEILEDEHGVSYVAEFPPEVTRRVQYGSTLKVNAVYMSQFQLIPYQRIEDHFMHQMNLPISAGSIYNFNQEAYKLLETFDAIAKQKLIESQVLHADETGINIGGKNFWLHSASNGLWSYFYPHKKRGVEAMHEIGILSKFKGTLCHDHWKPYYTFTACKHSLCNGHHLRELERVLEQENYLWAKKMKKLLPEINQKVQSYEGHLNKNDIHQYREQFRLILDQGDKECPPPKEKIKNKSRGLLAKSKSRNLLERLKNYENDTLRFMYEPGVPFTNNQAENDIRMTKVQQKISGCFRAIDGAKIFCRIRSFMSTCRKHGLNITNALNMLFQGKLPDFIKQMDSS